MTVRILIGDVRDKLAELPDESVHCVVTSPPYFGLRDYGTAQWDGGDPACDHKPNIRPRSERPNASGANIGKGGTYNDQQDLGVQAFRHICGKCGATRIDNQIGLEPTLAEYIDTMTAVFRDVRRVLRSDGVCWLNIGDSYSGMYSGRNDAGKDIGGRGGNLAGSGNPGGGQSRGIAQGFKPKDLMMVPARLALALQADGWWLRSDIIWQKPNPMPESVTDRPTNAHEHIFLLTKSARYWYDADAVAEESLNAGVVVKTNGNDGLGAGYDGNRTRDGFRRGVTVGATRNLRNVWSISTQGFPGAHFATFPPEIPRRCIKAGTSEKGACSACGAPWSRVVEVNRGERPPERGGKNYGLNAQGTSPTSALRRTGGDDWYEYAGTSHTTGWQPGCACDADVIPCTVMDIFFGSGTTGLVADQLGRDCIGIELSPEYARMAENRIRDASPMFAQVTA